MEYYFDTEFHEYFKQPKLFGIPVGKPIPTIDLISIGIVSGEKKYIGGVDSINGESKPTISKCNMSMEYYAISKEFNLRDAWNSYQPEINKQFPQGPEYNKVYWIRENVLKSIWKELFLKDEPLMFATKEMFTYGSLKYLIRKYGKTRQLIAREIIKFCERKVTIDKDAPNQIWSGGQLKIKGDPIFYAYYADYDWVVFCQSLFGRMNNLPDGFPMYCIDLKQMLDNEYMNQENKYKDLSRLDAWLKDVKKMPYYPKEENEHNALDDAKWNKKLHEFIESLPPS